MPRPRETLAFAAVLAALIAGFLSDALFSGRILSPGDVIYVDPAFSDLRPPAYEPRNRLLIDPVLQFRPWLEFSRETLRRGHLPLWNPYAGCGSPLLANGQSAVFDPFHLIACLGRLPEAYAWMAAARLWVAGLGLFWLASFWNYGRAGRWFCGLCYPFCGFLVVWLQYPVTSVAVWLPWLFVAVETVARRPGRGSTALLAAVVSLVLLGGHVQTSAHVLLAASLYAAWRWRGMARGAGRSLLAGLALGLGLAAVEVLPLAAYLTRSPVWSDRQQDQASVWDLRPPRLLDSACTALPYLFGSQRRGHPNLAKPLGVHNLNESSGGFAGLATLLWLAPLGASIRRSQPLATFLLGLTIVSALAAFQVPPLPNLIGLVPVLDVMDHRRLSLWLAFGLVSLGGLGIDQLGRANLDRRWRLWERCWQAAALVLLMASIAIPVLAPTLRPRVQAHYEKARAESWAHEDAPILADRQLRNLASFTPLYLGLSAVHLLGLSALSAASRTGRLSPKPAKAVVLGVVLLDLFAFGRGLNPAIDPRDDRPESPVVARLRQLAPPPARILPIEDALPPNRLMAYRLCDVRNYDSVELTRNLDWFAPLYEHEPGSVARHSRRQIRWAGVLRGLDRLRASGVAVIVAPSPPPEGRFAHVEKVGNVWLARLDTPTRRLATVLDNAIELEVHSDDPRPIPLAETNDPGWRLWIDGRGASAPRASSPFLELDIPPGRHHVRLLYDPPEVRLAVATSLASAIGWLLILVGPNLGLLAGKNARRAWTRPSDRVRIESMASSWSFRPAFPEG